MAPIRFSSGSAAGGGHRGASESAGGGAPPVNVDVIQTPNPDALKFVPGGDVTGSLRSVAVRCRPPPTPRSSRSPARCEEGGSRGELRAARAPRAADAAPRSAADLEGAALEDSFKRVRQPRPSQTHPP